MGWTIQTITITCALSNHNSDQDVKDEADYRELAERIEAICKEHRYKKIQPQMDWSEH